MAQVILKNLNKNFGKVEAVKNLNINCNDGEFMALLGPSGCGKSTTMRMIAGLETVSSGEIYIGDRMVNELSSKQRDIAMVFENYALYPHMTVYQNIAFPLFMSKISKDKIKKQVAKTAEILQLNDILEKFPLTLSDGQKQRVGIGRAIVREPSLFLFDEPISHLDVMLRQQMRKEIRRLQKELETTMIYVTHDQLEALSMADRIAVMNEGILQQLGTRDEILDSPNNIFVARFVGEPPINLLTANLKEENGDTVLIFNELENDSNFSLLIKETRSLKALKKATSDKVKVGIRPLDIELHHEPVEGSFPGNVFFIEVLDEFNIFTIQINDQKLLVEACKNFKADLDIKVWIKFNEPKMHFFDYVNGQNYLKKN